LKKIYLIVGLIIIVTYFIKGIVPKERYVKNLRTVSKGF